jgi:multidrug transporter EmrE-like cation transporter
MGPETKMLTRQRREMEVMEQLSTSSSEEEDESTPPIAAPRRQRWLRRKSSIQKRGITLALTSGLLAALAGTFGKLAVNGGETAALCEQVASVHMNYSSEEAFIICDKTSLFIRAISFVSMILLNTVMWTTFVKALRYCSTSLEATVTNTAANFFLSAIVGQLLFDESVSLMWWMGTALIILGLVLMNYGAKGGTSVKERRKKFKSR